MRWLMRWLRWCWDELRWDGRWLILILFPSSTISSPITISSTIFFFFFFRRFDFFQLLKWIFKWHFTCERWEREEMGKRYLSHHLPSHLISSTICLTIYHLISIYHLNLLSHLTHNCLNLPYYLIYHLTNHLIWYLISLWDRLEGWWVCLKPSHLAII